MAGYILQVIIFIDLNTTLLEVNLVRFSHRYGMKQLCLLHKHLSVLEIALSVYNALHLKIYSVVPIH